MTPLGFVRSPFREKFSVPRQPRLAARVRSELILDPPYSDPEAFRGIEQYSHLWLIFGFSLVPPEREFRPLVRPPRLGGNVRMGVFATRSPFRPNGLGLSAVRFAGMSVRDGGVILSFSGGDLVDGTPVYDIKPYVAFSDSVPDARCGMASEPPATSPVSFAPEAEEFLSRADPAIYPELADLITDILSYDHRPAYRAGSTDSHVYGFSLYDLNIRFCRRDGSVLVLSIAPGVSQ